MSRSRALALLLIGCACCGSAGARTAKEWAHIREKDMEDVERQWADGDAEEELVDDAQACMGPCRAAPAVWAPRVMRVLARGVGAATENSENEGGAARARDAAKVRCGFVLWRLNTWHARGRCNCDRPQRARPQRSDGVNGGEEGRWHADDDVCDA